ncbi:TetR/AcrR family transcriptional regulator [Parvibaculaceae bacterium PLY_AMNH_Bact1]|nr:TetR/AcrR family transcriptional regulator [Parvibaculaceae bacterium PLY_AMNH_Bact1]
MGLEGYRRRVSESKRKSIMAAAGAEFQDNGFTHAAMAEIARKADVSTATLYKHFGSKEELFSSIVEASYAGLEMPKSAAAEAKTAKEALTTAANDYLNQQFGSGINALMRAIISETSGVPEVGKSFLKRGVNGRNKDFVAFLDNLVERKLLKPHDTKMSSLQIVGMIKENFVWPTMFDPNFKLPSNKDAIIEEAIDTFLAHYGA